ncbi:MAG: hypothetical protein ABSF15_26235, partial [Candidatus Sulfotelmatobacter sp.]
MQSIVRDRLFRPLALRDITIDDDQSVGLTLFILNRGGDRFQNPPCSILVAHTVFKPLSASCKS